MKSSANRELKHYCPDFAPIRATLARLGARLTESKHQTDYFFFLPEDKSASGPRRLKLRIEPARAQLIYYANRIENGARVSDYHIMAVQPQETLTLLSAALRVKVVVRKQREVWRKDNALFNLDEVEEIGRIFEVEVEQTSDAAAHPGIEEFRAIFGPHLGAEIRVSNEDLLMSRHAR